MKQMFDISEKLVSEQSDEMYGVKTINLWRFFMEVFIFDCDEQVISLQRTKVHVFSDSVASWKDEREPLGSSVHQIAELLTELTVSRWEFEWNIFPGCITLQLSHKVQELLLRSSVTQEKFTGRVIFMSMFNDISWGSKENEKECKSNAQLVSLSARRFSPGKWSFLGPGSGKKWYSTSENSP